MPSDKKRINLTVPEPLYQQLQGYKETNGLTSDATTCLLLITRQLQQERETQVMLDLIRTLPRETLMQLSQKGLEIVRQEAEEKVP